MRKILVSTVVAASLGLASVAMAADTTATGAIKAMDAKACTITLADKTVYEFGKTCDFSKLKVGEKVVITYTKAGTMLNATAVKAAA